jgi:valacyclovir hydrolase
MAWFEHGGSRIFYEVAGSGTPVLLMPGWSGNIEEFSKLREQLVEAGYQVIAADLPGSGRSLPQPRAYTATYYEEDGRAFGALLEHLNVRAAHLVGLSDGGEVAILMAILTPEHARSVVTWGASGFISDPDGELEATFHMIDDPSPPVQEFRTYLVDYYGEANARTMTQNFARAAQAIIAQGGDISLSNADTIRCPALVIAGEHDEVVPPAQIKVLGARIPNARVEIVPNAGHDVYSDRPEWLTQTLLEWLNAH